MENFTHLHVHSSYSLLDGYCKPRDLVNRAVYLGMDSIAVTDHNHVGGIPEFFEEARKVGIKPIAGLEAYYTPDRSILSSPAANRNALAADAAFKAGVITEEERDAIVEQCKGVKGIKEIKERTKPYLYDTKGYHILFLAMNQNGWRNLVKMNSEAAATCTFNGRFHVDIPLVRKYADDLICTTACVASYPARKIFAGDIEAAEAYVDTFHEIFGDRFYLEVQPLTISEQMTVNRQYVAWSKEKNIKLVATNDVHYVTKWDHDDHDTLLCVGTKRYKDETDRMRYTNDFWLRSREEMEEYFKKNADDDEDLYNAYVAAMNETNIIAGRCDDKINFGAENSLLPKANLPDEEKSSKSYITRLAYKGLYDIAKRESFDKNKLAEYESRLAYEMDVVIKRHFEDYMLVVREYVTWAREHDIPVGPGRGSACGSLLLYCLGITHSVDPIKYNLLFERFLTVDKKGFPDIDVDFSKFKRESVIHHLEDEYGKDNVCHIGTYTQMGVKSGLKDIARVFRYSFDDANAISKEIDELAEFVPPQPLFADYDKLKDSPNKNERAMWDKFDALEKKYPTLFSTARKFEGLKRSFGIHASAILAMPSHVNDVFPTRLDNSTGVTVTLYPGTMIEELGGVKLDILGLVSLDNIEQTAKLINPEYNINTVYDMVDLDDPEPYKMLARGESDCVFQLESNMFKGLLKNIQPRNLDDIAATTSLGRPGPLSCHQDKQYAAAKNDGIKPDELLKGIDDITGPTYGIICYQETLMRISRRVAGFDVMQADALMRKAIAKKKIEMFPMIRRCLIYGKKNVKGPEGWEKNDDLPWYDPQKKYGAEIEGGISRGYTKEEIDLFWDDMRGYASYAFNASHAYAYSVISAIQAWLKYYYPVEFFTAALTIEEDDDKRKKYISVARRYGISVVHPDINLSEKGFTCDDKTIRYGIGSIKDVGPASVPELLEKRPYASLDDAVERVSKRALKKNVGVALIKSGAFDSFGDRYSLLNRFYELRKDKEPRIEGAPTEDDISQMELETLNASLTYPLWFDNLEEGCYVFEPCVIKSTREYVSKNKSVMCFLTIETHKSVIDCVMFAKTYKKYKDDIVLKTPVYFGGTKNDRDGFIIELIQKEA